jgi:hypothetical protein
VLYYWTAPARVDAGVCGSSDSSNFVQAAGAALQASIKSIKTAEKDRVEE